MARLIQKSGYFKGGSTGYMKYIAQRDGVEITSDTDPVTEKQRQLIEDLLKNYPDAKELFEYEDYLTTPNRATASAYIAAALDSHLHEMEPESGYMKYIAQRPRAEKHGGHGLFSAAPVTDLNKAVAELDAHTGRVWTFIFSLRREDAVQTGYDNAAAWRELLLQQSGTLAEALRIPQDKLRWYAAFHDEGYHPHVHMMVWSDDPRMGHLTKKGIFAMRSKLTGTIFREELKDVYIRKESIYKHPNGTGKAAGADRADGTADLPGYRNRADDAGAVAAALPIKRQAPVRVSAQAGKGHGRRHCRPAGTAARGGGVLCAMESGEGRAGAVS